MSQIYRGECKIMTGNIDEGVEMVRVGVTQAEKNPIDNKALIDRGRVLVRQFGA